MEKNRQSWRTDRLLGRAFCHKRTPPPKRPSPVIQAFSVKDTQTDSRENLVSRLSQLSSRLIEASHCSPPPPVKDLPLATNESIKNSYDPKTHFKEKL